MLSTTLSGPYNLTIITRFCTRIPFLLKEKDIVLSVDQIRKRIDKLKSHGLLLSGVKKQGSFITDEGKNFISYVKIKGVI